MENFHVAFWLMELFHELNESLKSYQEIAGFGLNVKTFFFLLTIFWSTMLTISLSAQARKIKRNESGKSISFLFYGFYIFPGMATGFYGYYRLKFALIFNAICLGFFGIRIIINLLRYQKYPRKEIFYGFSALLSAPLMIITPDYLRDYAFAISGFVVLWMMTRQAWTIFKEEGSGAFHPGPAINGIFSSSTWLTYAILFYIWPMMIFNFLAIIIWGLQVSLYFYKQKKGY